MTTAQWDIDRDSYFSNRRTVPVLKVEPKEEVKVEPNQKDTQKAKPVPKKQPVDKPAGTNPVFNLVNCLGAALFHGLIQLALYYVFITGAIDPDGLMVGSVANCAVAGFRVAWRFKP